MRLPNAELATVSEAKTARYLLSLTHPKGRTKAAFFRRFGFDAEHWQTLADALRLLTATHAVCERVQSPHGVSYVVEGALQAPDADADETPRFVTAYPAEDPRTPALE